jgi:crotonobetainyl-CoA:carnitine CoA-transferase CaiB-like acyl-CoA transferase
VSTTPPLSDLVVVDLSTGIAGAYCTKLLADGGAEVIKVEPPEGDPLRSWSASGAEITGGSDGALFAFLSSSKQSMVADPDDEDALERVHALLERADAVVWSKGSRLTDLAELAPSAIRAAAPHLTVTSITPFGLEGPWCDRAATEFTLQAWSGGIVGLGRGSPERAPVFVAGQIGEWLSGAYAAIGTMVSQARARRGAAGDLVDVSMLETLVMCLTYYPVTYHDMVGHPFREGRSLVTPGVETTSDGIVGVGVGTGQQWLDFCVMVDHPEWMEDRSLFANRAHLQPAIAAWMSGHTTAEILELTGSFRIPHAPVGNGASIPATDHFRARGSIVRNPRDGFDEPDRPYRFEPPVLRSPGPAPRLGEHDRTERASLAASPRPNEDDVGDATSPLEGLRVLDLTAFWAGPLCTHVLGMLGADVLHIESTARPDGTRLLSGLRFSEPDWWERSGIFSGLNTNKKSVTLDLTTDRGRELLRRLIATCDVIVENYTPRVLEQIGLDLDAVRAIRPDVVMVRMPGFGLDGPWRDDPAFAFVIEDAAGLTWMTGYPDQNPVSPYCVGDSNAGTHALCGLLLALEHRRRTGEGVLVEASMVDAALNVAAEQVIEYSANGARLERDGNRGPAAAPQNVYLTADVDAAGTRDGWVAIAVASDDQWLALRDALDRPDWAIDPALTTVAGRRAQHDTIDAELAVWCGARTGDEIVDCLWDAGVPVAKVLQPHDQPSLPQLQFRGFFEDVDHPLAGMARHSTMPIRFSRGPERFHRRHAPLLGEHNEDVLRSLGIPDDELAELEEQGVTGRVPDIARRSRK